MFHCGELHRLFSRNKNIENIQETMTKLVCLLAVVLLVVTLVEAQKDYDYEPGPGAPAADGSKDPKSDGGSAPPADGSAPSGAGKAGEGEPEPEEDDPNKTKFSDERFARLFPSRAGGRALQPRPAAKPKPTLPSFIKSTPPIIKAQISTTPAPRNLASQRQRAALQSTTTRKPSTARGQNSLRGRGALATTPRPLSGRLSTTTSSPSRSSASSTVSPAILAARRRFSNSAGTSGISRFQRNQNNHNNNATILALNPRRN